LEVEEFMTTNYASYGQRAGGFLIDWLFVWIPPIIGFVIALGLLFSDGLRPIGVLLLILAIFWLPAMWIYNQIIRQGKSGQTIGKSRVGTKLVKEQTGQPIGVGYSFLRWFLGWILGAVTGSLFTIVDLIFPAFDSKRQRVLDKMLGTIVIDSKIITPTQVITTPPSGAGSLYS
jgi:uncharacterized RDD family membrane protein YckC